LVKKINQIDEKIGFVKRKSKLNASTFVETLICSALNGEAISLERMCQLLNERGIAITKQGLHQRFNNEASMLLKNIFEESLKEFKRDKTDIIEILSPFTSIKIIDSSSLELPKHLESVFRGLGGVSSASSIKLQTVLNYTCTQVDSIFIQEGRSSDFSFLNHLESIEKNTLFYMI